MRPLTPPIINSGKQLSRSVGFSVNELIGDNVTKRELMDADIDKRYVRRDKNGCFNATGDVGSHSRATVGRDN